MDAAAISLGRRQSIASSLERLSGREARLCYISSDGVNWGSPVAASETIAMPATIDVGLVTLRNGSSAPAVTASFDGVPVPPQQ
jgi:hypothetical protein